MNQQAKAPTPIPGRAWAIAAVTGAGAFMAMLDSTVANLAIEAIRDDLSSSLSIVQWVATGYLCALAVSLPANAWLGARLGYGRLWAGSLIVFLLASVSCALAPDAPALIAARLVQGLAGGLMVPAGQAVIGSTIDKGQLGRIFGTLGLVIALGPAVGPVLGGLLLDAVSWRWLFWLNVPIGVVALIAAIGLVPRGERDPQRSIDVTAYTLLAVGLPLFLFGASDMGDAGNGEAGPVALALGVLLTVAFLVITIYRRNPLIDLTLLKRRMFSTATLTTGLTGANMYGGLLLIPLYLQLIAGADSVTTGLWLLVMGLGSAFVLPVAGALTDRFGGGGVSLAGAILLLISTLPLAWPQVPSTVSLAMCLVARGVGVALAQMPAMTAAYTTAAADEMGDATTLVNIVQRVGGALGAVGVVVLVQQTGGTGRIGAHNVAFSALAIVSALTMVSAALLHRQSRHHPANAVEATD